MLEESKLEPSRSIQQGGWSQTGLISSKADVGGSKPSRATNLHGCSSAGLERDSAKVEVTSSILVSRTISIRRSSNSRTRDFDSRNRGSNPRRRANTTGRSSNGRTADSKPANRCSNHRRPANHDAVAERLGARLQISSIPVQVRAASPLRRPPA